MPLSAGNVPVTIPKYFYDLLLGKQKLDSWFFAKMTRPEVLRSKRETGWIVSIPVVYSNVQHSYAEYCHLPFTVGWTKAFRLVY